MAIIGMALAGCGGQSGPEPAAMDPCTLHLRPGPDDQLAVQSALLGAGVGSIICLEGGTYRLSDGLSVGAPGLTLRSVGGDAVLDFRRQGSPAPGLDVTGDDVSLEGITLRGAKGTGIRVLGADNVHLSEVRLSWKTERKDDAEEMHGIALLEASNVLVKDVEVEGAPGAGIYSSGSADLLIEGASLRGNGIGVEIRGGIDVEVAGSLLQGNGEAFVIVEEPGAEGRMKIHDNLVEELHPSEP